MALENELTEQGFVPAESEQAPDTSLESELEGVGFQTETPQGTGLVEGLAAGARRGTGAALQSGFTVAGAAMGTQIGLATGPAAPVAAPLGALAGGAAGFFAGDELAELAQRFGIAETSVEDLPKEQRPFGVGGEVLGGSLAFMAPPVLAAQFGARLPSSYVGDYINRIIDTAVKSPQAFFLSELVSAEGAAIGGATAEIIDPGSTSSRVIGEITVGVLSPIRLATSGAKKTARILQTTLQRLSPAGRQTRAGEILLDMMREAGEDPDAVMALLRSPDVLEHVGPQLTAAQKTGIKEFARFEAGLRAINKEFGFEAAEQVDNVLQSTANAIALLRATGDKQALKLAGELRVHQFRVLLGSRLQAAERKVMDAASKITRDTPKARAELSKTASGILDDTLDRARDVESALWNKIPDGQMVGGDGVKKTVARYSALRAEMLEDEIIDPVIDKTVNKLTRAQKILGQVANGADVDPEDLQFAQKHLTVKNLINIRKRSLKLAREEFAKGNHTNARFFGEIAEGILDDLGELEVSGVEESAYDVARTFSRQLNDTFTRTFVGKSQSVTSRGANTMPPEILLKRALATGEEMADLQMRQIEEATRFLIDQGFGQTVDDVSLQTILDAQERVLRLGAAQSVMRDPVSNTITGVDLKKLRGFMSKHEAVLERFPNVKESLETALQAEGGRSSLMNQARRAQNFLDKKSIFGQLAQFDSPVDAVRGALKSANPARQIKAMANLARKGGDDAVAGLRASMVEDAFRSATRVDGTDVTSLVSALSDPIRPGHPSLLQIMKNEKIVTVAQGDLLDAAVDRLRRILVAEGARPTPTPPTEEIDAFFDTAVRIIGSRVGSQAAGGRTGPQLIAAARGSATARKMLENIPLQKVQQLLIAAMRGDPVKPGAPPFSLMETMMDRAKSATVQEFLTRQIHAFAIQNVFFATEDMLIEGEN